MKEFIVMSDNGISRNFEAQFDTYTEAKTYAKSKTEYFKIRDTKVDYYIFRKQEM